MENNCFTQLGLQQLEHRAIPNGVCSLVSDLLPAHSDLLSGMEQSVREEQERRAEQRQRHKCRYWSKEYLVS